jgi:hypothetical protein
MNLPTIEMGWAIYTSHWQVEAVWPDGSLKEKIAYTNFFFAAEAAYEAAKISLPHDRIVFRQRARVIRKSWDDGR